MSPLYDPRPRIAERFRRGGRSDGIVSTNERALLRLVWRQQRPSRAEVMAQLDITQQSVHRIVEQLSARGMLAIGPPKPAIGRGQPSPTLTLRPDWGFTIGLSVNTDSIGVAVMDFSGRATTQLIDTAGLSLMAALERTSHKIDAMLTAQALPRAALFGVGVGIQGFRLQGTQFNASLPLHEWSLIELSPLLSEHFDAPVWTENGANTAAICEAMQGVGRHIQSFAYLSFNYGFGGGLIVDGELMRGGFGNAGEFSAVFTEEETKRRPALSLLMAALKAKGVDVSSIHHLQRSFDPAWPGVEEWVETTMPAYNRVINMIWSVLDPQAIVLGGQIPTKLAEIFCRRAEFIELLRYGVPRPKPKLIVTEQTTHPSAIGAAALPFKEEVF